MSDHRVLVVTPVFTHPPSQGNAARILAFGRELQARGLIVDVVHYSLDFLTTEGHEAMCREWNSVHLIPARPHQPQSHATHWGLDDWCHSDVCSTVERLCRTRRYLAVIASYVWMSRCLDEVRGPLRILDTHDLFGDRHLLSRQSGLEPNWYFTTVAEESRGFDRADIVIGIQREETAKIAARTRAKAITVGHPMAASFLTQPASSYRAAEYGFLASANPWNIASLQQLDARLASRFPECDWSVAGTICRALPPLATRPFELGVVREPQDFYRHVGCCLNPMVGGTGLKIKTIEAMAYGAPIMGTREAFEGLGASYRLHALATLDEMVEAMREHHRSVALQRELAVESRRLFARYTSETMRQYDELTAMILKS